MLKEVGSSGQLSLGKKFAGRLFEVVAHPDGRFELVPVKVVPQLVPVAAAASPPDGWLPPGGYAQCSPWALDNRAALEAYAQRMEEEGTAAEQLQAFLVASPGSERG